MVFHLLKEYHLEAFHPLLRLSLTKRISTERVRNYRKSYKVTEHKMEKRTVKKIYHVDNYTLIRAIVIGIAYREKMKNRKNFLQRASNQQVQAAVYKAVCSCKLFNRKADIHDLPDLEKYFKYRLILLNEDYLNSKNIIYINKNANYKKTIY